MGVPVTHGPFHKGYRLHRSTQMLSHSAL